MKENEWDTGRITDSIEEELHPDKIEWTEEPFIPEPLGIEPLLEKFLLREVDLDMETLRTSITNTSTALNAIAATMRDSADRAKELEGAFDRLQEDLDQRTMIFTLILLLILCIAAIVIGLIA
jgi:hypothetical protein